MLWIANKEVKLLTEKQRDTEKLSFKEQILRDLERVKEQDRREREVEIPNVKTSSTQPSSVTPVSPEPETSTEELMANSLSVVDKILKNAPSVPPLSSSEIEEKDGLAAAQLKLYQQLQQNPATPIFHRFIQYQIDDAENGRGKDSLILLHKMVGERIKQTFDYRCSNCGYQTHKLIWCCPSCRQWETIKPVSAIEHD